MNGLEFIINLFWIISIDLALSFILFVVYRYIDYKYFSELEIEQLKIENKYLKEENKKINGTSTDFWRDKI